MEPNLTTVFSDKTILELRNLQRQGNLNLEPGFQRMSVWTQRDRKKLIQSIFENYPVPSIFLYHREENGMPVYDVLDGKQRLETIFMFSKVKPFARKGFEVKHQFPEDDEAYWWDWKELERDGRAGKFLTYKIQVAEVRGHGAIVADRSPVRGGPGGTSGPGCGQNAANGEVLAAGLQEP